MIALLYDIGPPGGSIGAAAIVGGFLVLAALAYIVFRLMRKTVRIAIRLAIFAAIIIVGLLVAAGLFLYGGGGRGPVNPPAPQRTR